MMRISMKLGTTALLLALLLPVVAVAGEKENQRAREAVTVLDEIMRAPDQAIPERLLEDAHAIAVIPNVVKAGFVIGGRAGKGLIAIKTADGTWSHPSYLKLTGASVGFQAGVQATDVVLVFRSQRGVDSIVNGKFTLGADATVAAGPVGRTAQASTDGQLKAEIYSYSRARGLFAGVALDGAVIAIDHRANQSVYGRNTTPRAIFEGRVGGAPGEIIDFRDRLEEYGAR
jgi:lipid-binding SYLF domain-containing protein